MKAHAVEDTECCLQLFRSVQRLSRSLLQAVHAGALDWQINAKLELCMEKATPSASALPFFSFMLTIDPQKPRLAA